MTASPRDNYLETEVLTASPQKLHLMLVEAAVRAVARARQFWADGQHEAGSESVLRAQEIVAEMLAALNREAHPDLTAKIAAVYLFVYRSLIDALPQRDAAKLADALRVLEIERDTWRTVCSRTDKSAQRNSPPTPPLPLPGNDPFGPAEPLSGFSIEA